MRLLTPLALLLLVCSLGGAKVYLFDFGTDKSAVQEGFTQVTPQTVWGGEAAAGFVKSEKLEAAEQAYAEYVEGSSGKVPPPMWTTPLTQDCVRSVEPVEFVAKVEPGKYHAWVLCGTSVNYRYQYFDFAVASGETSKPVQFEGPCQFRHVYLDIDAAGGEARIRIEPRNLFVVAGLALWQDGDEKTVQEQVIAPQRKVLEFLPDEEAAKWTLDQRPDPTPWPEISANDQKRGYLVHYRHWADVVYPDTVPIAQEISPGIRAFATPGEYEPLNFIVWPLKGFNSATVTVSDLRSQAGAIPGSAVEIRRVRYAYVRPNYSLLGQYRVAPESLMPYDPSQPLPEKQNTRYWLTVRVPETTKPGVYRGTITFQPEGSTPHGIPVALRVLPFTLQEDPDKIYGIYYYDPLDSWFNAKDEVSKAYFLQKSEYEMQDMVAHGTRNVTASLWAAPAKADTPGVFSFNFDLMQTRIDQYRKYNFKFPLVCGVNSGGIYQKYMKEELGSHASKAKVPPPEYGQELTLMCKAIETERVKRGWPEFLYYPIDEPSNRAETVAFMVETLKAVRAAGVRTYVTADPSNDGFDPMRPYVDVWCTQPFLPLREEILADKQARKVDYWCYPNHISGENDHTPVNGARMTYGFGFWRSGFTTLIPWIYRSDAGDPWNNLSGRMQDFMVRTEDNGRPIPVTLWEAMREGYDDYRYVNTCQQMIERGTAQGGKAKRAAEDAQQQLEFIFKQIRVQPKYKQDNLWEPRETDVYRWLVAEQILKLQAAGVK